MKLFTACAALTLLCKCAGTKRKPATPLMGFSTWNTFGCAINESLIVEIAEAMVDNGLRDAGYSFINLDDCWAAEQRNATGHMYGDPASFPSGIHSLSEQLHRLNFSFGLYTSRATRTCSNKMPGSLGHEQIDADTFAAFGADFVKNDDCRVTYADAVKDYSAMQRAIAAADRPMFHNVKAPDLPPLQAAGVSQFRRVGKDLGNDWDDLMRMLDTGSDPRFAAQAGPANGFFNDFDMLFVGVPVNAKTTAPPLTYQEQTAHFSLWAALKSPLVLGNDPRHVDNATLQILTNEDVLRVNQDPLGLQAVKIGTPQRGKRAALNLTHSRLRLDRCDDGAGPESDMQAWVLDQATRTIRSAVDTDYCITIEGCVTRWPFSVHLDKCGSSSGSTAQCSANNTQTFSINATSGVWKWDPADASHGAFCWGDGEKSCCMSAEGLNPELDSCGWAEDVSQQQWALADVVAGAHSETSVDGQSFSIISLQQNLCLTIAGDLEVYGSMLSTGCATVVLLNRSPSAENITVSVKDLVAEIGFVAPTSGNSTVYDLLEHRQSGVVPNDGAFTDEVPSHSVVHVNICPA